MSSAPTPTWLDEETSTTEKPILGNQNNGGSNVMNLSKKQLYFYWGLKVLTIGGCALMAMTAAVGMSYMNTVLDVGKIFIAIFMFLFSGMLIIFEASQVYSCPAVDNMFKRNFGFLYGAKGKAFYIVFIAFLSFGLDEPANLCVTTGIFMAAFGVAQVVIYLKWPELYSE